MRELLQGSLGEWYLIVSGLSSSGYICRPNQIPSQSDDLGTKLGRIDKLQIL